jgi:organic radical activating enzyme
MDKIDNLRKEIIESETFCFHPYLELSTNPAGHTRPCCYYDGYLYPDNTTKLDIANALSIHTPGSTFEKIWKTENLQDLRRSMWQGNLPKECAVCKRDGDASMRARSVKEYKNDREVLQLVNDTINNDFKVEHLPTRLELKPSNLCNLKCVMCNSYDSSQIGKELTEMATKFKGINVVAGRFESINNDREGIIEANVAYQEVPSTDYSENEGVWNSFVTMAPTLTVLSFAGGEPTLSEFVLRALRYCVENNYAKNIVVFCSSNYTNLNKNFLELMPHYKRFELIASIDGFEKVQEYTRFPSKWESIKKNYIRAKQYTAHSNVKIVMNITVTSLNVLNLDKLLYWIDEQANTAPYFNYWPYNLNLLWSPYYQRIEYLPDHIKLEAIQRLKKYKETSTVLKEFPEMHGIVDVVINQLHSKEINDMNIEHGIKKFGSMLQVLDEHRDIDINEYIPDLKGVYK